MIQFGYSTRRAARRKASGVMLEKVDRHVQKLAAGVGWISLAIGLFLTSAPSRSAESLGWGDRERLALIVGLSDLVVGPGLLLDRDHRQQWMRVRALLSAAITLSYAWVLAGPSPRQKRASSMLGLMIGVTATDYLLSRRLRDVNPSVKKWVLGRDS